MKQMKKAAAFCLCLLLGIQSVSQWGNVDVYADADTDVAQSLTLEVGGKEEVKVTLSEEESIAVSSENSKIADGIVTGKSVISSGGTKEYGYTITVSGNQIGETVIYVKNQDEIVETIHVSVQAKELNAECCVGSKQSYTLTTAYSEDLSVEGIKGITGKVTSKIQEQSSITINNETTTIVTYKYVFELTFPEIGEYESRISGSESGLIAVVKANIKEHQWDEGVIQKEATCTEKGEKEHTCEVCGETRTEEINALGHTWAEAYTVEQEPTCTEKGQKSIHCVTCDIVKEDSIEEIPATGHTWNEEYTVDVAPTCTETGEKSIHCATCNAIKEGSEEEVEPVGHIWNDKYTIDKEPTCTEEGVKALHCTACGEEKEDSQVIIPKTGHDYGDWVVTKEATLTEEGMQVKTCKHCGNEVS